MLILLCSIIKGYHIRRMWATGVNLCNTFDLLRNDQPRVNLIIRGSFTSFEFLREHRMIWKVLILIHCGPYWWHDHPSAIFSFDPHNILWIDTVYHTIFATFYTSGDAPAVFVNCKLTNLKYKSLTGYLTNLPDRSISDLLHRAFDQMSWTYRPSWRRR